MFWNKNKHTNEETAKEFQEWMLNEKKAHVVASCQDAEAIHARVKGRLFSLLSLSVPLCSACCAAAYTDKSYSPLCAYMAAGFLLVVATCILGLLPNKIMSAHIGPETIDKIMNLSPKARDKAEGERRIITYLDKVSLFNLEKAKINRRYLKASWGLLFLTPIIASFIACITAR